MKNHPASNFFFSFFSLLAVDVAKQRLECRKSYTNSMSLVKHKLDNCSLGNVAGELKSNFALMDRARFELAASCSFAALSLFLTRKGERTEHLSGARFSVLRRSTGTPGFNKFGMHNCSPPILDSELKCIPSLREKKKGLAMRIP